MIKNSSYVSRQPIAPIHLSIQPNAWPIFRECSTPSFHRHFIICTFGIGYVLYVIPVHLARSDADDDNDYDDGEAVTVGVYVSFQYIS